MIYKVAMAFWINIYGCQTYPRHGPLKVNQLKNDISFVFELSIAIVRHCSLTFDLYKMTQVIMKGLKFFFQGKSIAAATTSKTFPFR